MTEFVAQEIEFIQESEEEYQFAITRVEDNAVTIQRDGRTVEFEITPDGFKCDSALYPTFENMLINVFDTFQDTFFAILNRKLE